MFGFLALLGIGLLTLATGVGYLVWPQPTPVVEPVAQSAARPVEVPVEVEPPKGLKDIFENAPKKTDAGGLPGGPKFDFPPPPGVPGPFPQPMVPGMPGGPGPTFAAVRPLPIQTTPLKGDRVELDLGPVGQVTPAAGGRFLLIHLPEKKVVAVFDVNQGRVVKDVPADDTEVFLAGGMNSFVVYLKGKDLAERWDCRTLLPVGAAKAAFPGPVRGMGMGSASNGPLAVAVGGPRQSPNGGATFAYFDPATMKEVNYGLDGVANPFGLGDREGPVAVRVSGDGSVVVGFGGPFGAAESNQIVGGRVNRRWRPNTPYLVPAADGKTAFTFSNWYTPALTAMRERPPVVGAGMVPAVHGNAYLTIKSEAGGHRVRAYRMGQPGEVADVGLMAELDGAFRGADAKTEGYSQNLFLIPDAKLLAIVPTKERKNLVLRRLDLGPAK